MKKLGWVLGTAVAMIVPAGGGCDTGSGSETATGADSAADTAPGIDTPAGQDTATRNDARVATDTSPDSDAATALFGCGSAMDCSGPCAGNACTTTCTDRIRTPNGQALFEAAVQCGATACLTGPGDPCQDAAAEDCYDCLGAALRTVCKAQNDACYADG